jgi:metal-responsive CopG/Arc/MetJ family transcriptional regulator
MHTQKVAITVPKHILLMIDKMSQAKKMSRSKLISSILEQKIIEEKASYIKLAYDDVYGNQTIRNEQQSTTLWFEGIGNEGGQEW